MPAKLKKKQVKHTAVSGYRAKFALCAKHCRGNAQCMSRCLKKARASAQ